ncbi:MAG: CvpA family protein [Chlorobi bacterium]|nr:CvpA family protein [Chlorobiota bacterium]
MHWLDWFVIGVLALGFLFGVFRGLVDTLFSVVGLVSAVLATIYVAPLLVMELGLTHQPLMVILVFVLTFLTFWLLIKGVGTLIEKSLSAVGIGGLNRLLGGLLYFAFISVVLGVLVVKGKSFLPPDFVATSKTLPFLEFIGELFLNSVSKLIAKYS